jgi:glutathione-regulated potassium-efflux system ancillary protein KefF
MIDLVYAHPYPRRSRANAALIAAASDLPFVRVRALYELYPDFSIDVEAEQEALASSGVLGWQHPIFWYSVPPLLKLWIDKVLAIGFAYGEGGDKLRGKTCQWAVTTGGDHAAYGPEGLHNHPFPTFIPPLAQTARFCGMEFPPPFIVHDAQRLSEEALAGTAARYRERLTQLEERHG